MNQVLVDNQSRVRNIRGQFWRNMARAVYLTLIVGGVFINVSAIKNNMSARQRLTNAESSTIVEIRQERQIHAWEAELSKGVERVESQLFELADWHRFVKGLDEFVAVYPGDVVNSYLSNDWPMDKGPFKSFVHIPSGEFELGIQTTYRLNGVYGVPESATIEYKKLKKLKSNANHVIEFDNIFADNEYSLVTKLNDEPSAISRIPNHRDDLQVSGPAMVWNGFLYGIQPSFYGPKIPYDYRSNSKPSEFIQLAEISFGKVVGAIQSSQEEITVRLVVKSSAPATMKAWSPGFTQEFLHAIRGGWPVIDQLRYDANRRAYIASGFSKDTIDEGEK